MAVLVAVVVVVVLVIWVSRHCRVPRKHSKGDESCSLSRVSGRPTVVIVIAAAVVAVGASGAEGSGCVGRALAPAG